MLNEPNNVALLCAGEYVIGFLLESYDQLTSFISEIFGNLTAMNVRSCVSIGVRSTHCFFPVLSIEFHNRQFSKENYSCHKLRGVKYTFLVNERN